MKKGAKEHWIATFDGGAGVKSHGGLWRFESFAMRLKPSWQTMITYKTNNTGKDILSESEALLTTGELGETLRPLISAACTLDEPSRAAVTLQPHPRRDVQHPVAPHGQLTDEPPGDIRQ